MMKNSLFLIPLSVLFLFACGGDSAEESVENKEELADTVQLEFESSIRPDFEDWNLSTTYTDTLIFSSWDDNYDYWYAFFETQKGESVSLVADEAIEDKFGGSVMLVEWKIDSLYEAGEGDELYYKERLLSYTILEKGNSFEGFLQDFIKAYSRESDDLIADFMNEEAGFIGSMHPGLYCLASGDGPTVESFISWDCVIAEGFPEGDFCEGYEGVEDGLYFEAIPENKLPSFDDMSGDEMPYSEKVSIPSGFEESTIMKVLIVVEEYHFRYLYFLEGEEGWFFWIEDICDCSA